jgi:hypothetical protein
MKKMFLALAFVGIAVEASAQTPGPITTTVMTVYRQGQPTPAAAPYTIPQNQIQCGQPVVNPPAGAIQNPTQARWNDPASTTATPLDCVWTDPGGGLFSMLTTDATVTYEATLKVGNSLGFAQESARSAVFSKPGVLPAVPARFRVLRP